MQNDIKRRTFISTFSLFFQSGYAAALGLVANLIITIILTPAIFGIYFTVLSIISFLNYFSDIGLAASLIQKKHVAPDDEMTTFTVQQALTGFLVFIGILGTGFIMNFYKLPADGKYLYWSLLIGFFISSMKTIPSVRLERQIKFQKLVFVQVIESTVFYATISILALMGFGLTSFTIAVLLRAVVGLVMIYSISFWRPRIGISVPHLKELANFGLPFQASSFLALFKDDLIILYLGKVIGFEALGYIGWAKKWADAPLRIIMDNVSRVLFPLIATFQTDKKRLQEVSEKILSYQTTLLAPAITGLAITVSVFVQVIPKYAKWEPALPIFYILCLSSLILSLSAPFMNLFNAIGKVKITFTFMLIITVLNWIATPILTTMYGNYGFPIAHLLISLTLGLILIKAEKMLGTRVVASVYKPLLGSLGMGALLLLIRGVLEPSYISIAVLCVTGAVVYYGIMKYVFSTDVISQLLALYQKKS